MCSENSNWPGDEEAGSYISPSLKFQGEAFRMVGTITQSMRPRHKSIEKKGQEEMAEDEKARP